MPTLNFRLSETRKIVKKNFLSENFSFKMQNSELKTSILCRLKDKSKIMSTHNLLCRKFATSVENCNASFFERSMLHFVVFLMLKYGLLSN